MTFDFVKFLIGQTLAEREGVSRARATQLALVPAFLDMSLPVTLVMTQAMARREAPVQPAAGPAIKVPHTEILGQDYRYAEGYLVASGFSNVTTAEGNIDLAKQYQVESVEPTTVSNRSDSITVKYYIPQQYNVGGG